MSKKEISNIKGVDKVVAEILKMDYSKIDNIEMADVKAWDYPDFSDAYIESADYNGVAMTDKQLNEINDDGDFVYQCVENHLY